MSVLRPALSLLVLFTILTGAVYPLAITGLAAILFPHQAEGSLIRDGDRVVGSELIGQPFEDPRYFWGRPSATGPTPYNAAASTGSNLGPSNPALLEAISKRVEAGTKPPIDLVTTSGSGLDPHVSPAAALFQVARVAKARALSEESVRALIERFIEPRTLGILGEPRVNVLLLNRALDRLPGSGA